MEANFLHHPRIGPGFRLDNLVQHQREHLGRSRLDVDRAGGAVQIAHPLGMILEVGIVIENRLRAVLPRRQARKLVGKTVGRIIDAKRLVRAKTLHVDAEEGLGIEPIRSVARLGRGLVLFVGFLQKNVQPAGDCLMEALRIERNFECRRPLGACRRNGGKLRQ